MKTDTRLKTDVPLKNAISNGNYFPFATHHHCKLFKYGSAFCLYCFRQYPTRDITEWTDDHSTAICPECPIDAVVPATATHLSRAPQYRNNGFGQPFPENITGKELFQWAHGPWMDRPPPDILDYHDVCDNNVQEFKKIGSGYCFSCSKRVTPDEIPEINNPTTHTVSCSRCDEETVIPTTFPLSANMNSQIGDYFDQWCDEHTPVTW